MEKKKSEKASLESKKIIFTEIGLIIALLILYGAFECTTRSKDISELTGMLIDAPEQEMVEITREEPPKPEVEEPKPDEMPPPDDPQIEETENPDEDESSAFRGTEDNPESSLNLSGFTFEDPKEVKEEVFQRVEKMPQFPGGNEALQRAIASNLEYPIEAIELNQQGTVVVQFVVNSEGKATDPVVLRGVSNFLDKAAMDVIAKLPRFEPGEQAGKKVSVYYRVPIDFRLQR